MSMFSAIAVPEGYNHPRSPFDRAISSRKRGGADNQQEAPQASYRQGITPAQFVHVLLRIAMHKFEGSIKGWTGAIIKSQ
jgi:hypothetical protein